VLLNLQSNAIKFVKDRGDVKIKAVLVPNKSQFSPEMSEWLNGNLILEEDSFFDW